jgi:hypothetical protein
MPPQPATRADAPPSSGRKILGLPRNQFLIIAVVGAALIIGVIVYNRRKAAAAASTATSTGTGGCPDGSTPDANGNCPDSTDLAGELATLQTELGDLQANQGAGAAGGGTTGTIGGATGTGASTTPVAGTGTAGGTSTAAPSTPGTSSGSYKFPAPTGLKATRVSSHGCTLSWNAVTGPGGQKPVSYTVHTTGGGTDYSHIAAGTSTGEYGPGGTNLKPSTTYTSEVWANGGPIAPPHATVTWQTLKAGG